MEILDRLKTVESKIDHLSRKSIPTPIYGISQPPSAFPTTTPVLVDSDAQESLATSSVPPTSPTGALHRGGYRYESSVSRILEWPVMRQMFDSLGQKPQSPLHEHDLSSIPRGLHDSNMPLPLDGIQAIGISGNNNTLRVPLHLSGSQQGMNLTPPSIDWDTMQRLTKGYFDCFNVLYPIMDRPWFNTNTLTSIINNGFQEGTNSALVLLVFALGEVALSASGVPISVYKGRPSGIKGGTADRPPGVGYFNEGRKRMGFALAEVSLENVQMFALAALYHLSCGQAIVSGLASWTTACPLTRCTGRLADDSSSVVGLSSVDYQV